MATLSGWMHASSTRDDGVAHQHISPGLTEWPGVCAGWALHLSLVSSMHVHHNRYPVVVDNTRSSRWDDDPESPLVGSSPTPASGCCIYTWMSITHPSGVGWYQQIPPHHWMRMLFTGVDACQCIAGNRYATGIPRPHDVRRVLAVVLMPIMSPSSSSSTPP